MSKSLGNYFTIREIFGKSEWSTDITGEVLRYFLLSNHYRGPLDFSDQALRESKSALDGFYDLFNRLEENADTAGSGDEKLNTAIEHLRTGFEQAMNDDLSTPAAIAKLQGYRSELNKLLAVGLSNSARKDARETFRSMGGVLGLFQLERWQFNADPSEIGTSGPTEEDIEVKLQERNEARKRKDFAKADEIRKSLAAQGIIVEDKPDGTTRWKR
jgi:cysteinyl-tRNA synthetase